MRLKSIYISNYKNLKDFTLTFDGESFLDVFVGKNGTGKSNFFEAIIEIFRHLYNFNSDDGYIISFDYSISYEINGSSFEIFWKKGKLVINNDLVVKFLSGILPDNILIYYSGHNMFVEELLDYYEENIKRRIKLSPITESRKFIGVNGDYRQLFLTLLLIQNEDNKARRFLFEKLEIESIANDIKVVLRRPAYAILKKRFDIVLNDETDRYWKPVGITKEFLDKLTLCVSDEPTALLRDVGYMAASDYYILYFDIEKVAREFHDYTLQDLFRNFDNLKILGMLSEITISIKLKNGHYASLDQFSDGQFQSVYIYSIIEIFKDRNCITLLDEPDSFLHPEWQNEFFDQVLEINESNTNNHMLMSSHSAVTLVSHDARKIKYFDIKNTYVNYYELPKRIAIKKLCSSIIRYSEEEQILSILNAIQVEKKPIVFTEGCSDPIILRHAWFKLYDEEMPFIPFYAFSCNYLSQLIVDEKLLKEMNGRAIFGIFDFDKAYNQWNGIRGEVIQVNPIEGLIKKCEIGNVYALMLPIPNNAEIQAQVIKDVSKNETYKDFSYCEIEHLFYGSKFAESYFQYEPCVGGRKIVFKSDRDKVQFAQEIVPKIEDEYFNVFRCMFEFIKSKCF